jgi:ABC-type antimicrobial peptide transport system permease subunit
VALFATLAVVLAAIGIYGVISYSVGQRTREFGVRVALGARSWDILQNVMSHGMKLAAGGVAIGILGALLLSRVLRALLYEVSSTDPITYAIVAAAAIGIAAAACYVPARRATNADPMSALRAE